MTGLTRCIPARHFATHPRTIPASGLIPRVTGRGPFVESPHLEPIGNFERAQNIQLIQGSSLNSCMDSIIYLSTDLRCLARNMNILCGSVWYQEFRGKKLNKLLHTYDLAERSNLAILQVKQGQVWILRSSKRLAGWAGCNLQFDISPSNLEVRGQGTMVVRGSGSLYQVELGSDQEVFISANAFIATTGRVSASILDFDKGSKTLTKNIKKVWVCVKQIAMEMIEHIHEMCVPDIGKHIMPKNLNKIDTRALKVLSKKPTKELTKAYMHASALKVSGPGILMLQNGL